MDTDRLLRIFGRMMESHGTLFASAFAAIIALFLLVFISRKMRNRKTKPKAGKAASKAELGAIENTSLSMDDDADLDLTMIDDFDADFAANADDNAIIADMKLDNEIEIDELDKHISDSFMNDAKDLDDLDDITIPKIGEAPPPKQSRFFSSSWLGRKNNSDSPSISLDMTPSDVDMRNVETSTATQKSAAECARLGEIERRLMALRELYEAGLIAPEVYVVKAREFASHV